jgi:hypothetical protein
MAFRRAITLVGFIATNLPIEPTRVVRLYRQRGTADPHIKERKYAFHWKQLSLRGLCEN